MTIETLTLTDQWDKVFPASEGVHHEKVTFHNRFGITVAADLYRPKNVSGRLPALAVSGPFGAVKEQSSGLYAQTMAGRGFLTVAFDPSYPRQGGGTPRPARGPPAGRPPGPPAPRPRRRRRRTGTRWPRPRSRAP